MEIEKKRKKKCDNHSEMFFSRVCIKKIKRHVLKAFSFFYSSCRSIFLNVVLRHTLCQQASRKSNDICAHREIKSTGRARFFFLSLSFPQSFL